MSVEFARGFARLGSAAYIMIDSILLSEHCTHVGYCLFGILILIENNLYGKIWNRKTCRTAMKYLFYPANF